MDGTWPARLILLGSGKNIRSQVGNLKLENLHGEKSCRKSQFHAFIQHPLYAHIAALSTLVRVILVVAYTSLAFLDLSSEM